MIHKPKTTIFLVVVVALLIVGAIGKSYSISSPVSSYVQGDLISLSGQWQTGAVDESEGTQDFLFEIPSDISGSPVLSLQLSTSQAQLFLNTQSLLDQSPEMNYKDNLRYWITLPQDPGGSVLVLRLPLGLDAETVAAYSYLGDSGAVFFQFFHNNVYALVFSIFAFLLGVGVLLIHFCTRKVQGVKRTRTFLHLGIFVLLAGIWVMCDSQLTLFFCGQSDTAALVADMAFYAMPIFLLLYVQNLLSQPSPLLDSLCLLQIVAFLASLALSLFLGREVSAVTILCDGLMAVDTACTIVLCWQDLKHHHNESLYSVLLSFPLIGLFTFLALMAHVFTPGGGYTYLFSIGVFFFVIFLALSGANQLSHHLRQSASAEAYQKLAYTDVLTGLKNRMAYEEHLSKEETASGRETYVVFDVNNLKHINDTYGHQSGDTAIIQTARAIQRSFGDLGSCYRVGGDEFLAILQNTNEEEILSACRQTIETLTQFSKGNTFPVQVAIGYASSEQQGARGLALFHQADRQMYLVKQQQKEAALA